MKARSKNWLGARTGGRLKIAEREKREWQQQLVKKERGLINVHRYVI